MASSKLNAAAVGAAPASGGRRPGSKLGQMRFMQRAAQKTAAALVQEATIEDPDRWTTDDAAGHASCRVLVEDAPPPGAAVGHMSFGAFNPAVEAMQADAETAAAAAAARRAVPADAGGVSISDADMAAVLARAREASANGAASAPAAVAGGASVPAAGRGAYGISSEASKDGARPADTEESGILRFDGGFGGVGGGSGSGKGHQKGGKRRVPEEQVKPLRDPKRKKHERNS